MFSRREFLQVSAAAGALLGGTSLLRPAAAQQSITQDDLLAFDPVGNVTLLHVTDIHAQLVPVYFREPSVNLGVGEVAGLPPHITGKEFLSTFDLTPGSYKAYSMASTDFLALAKEYGRIGGMDRMATLVNAIRAERPTQTLFLDGGDTWQGSYTSLQTQGEDMVRVMNAMKTDAMTAHWEFTYGTERVEELIDQMDFPFLAANVRDTDWEEPVFESTSYFERGGVKVAVIGQAFPYTPIANPRYMIPSWSFGIREKELQERVDEARAEGAGLVVLLSHNGFDVDRKLASNVTGLDVVLTGHTHDAVPEAIKVGKTLLIASGSHGKFLSRLDLDIRDGEVKDFRYRLIPVLSDVIAPDPEMAAVIKDVRAPYEADVNRVLGKTESLLYRRGNFNGTFDDLICDALLSERDAQIALSPGFRWGATLLPGQDITVDDVYNMTAITYPNAYRNEMTGQMLKDILEDVADNLFNPDPYYQQGGDMVRVGGMGYRIDPTKAIGSRISDMTLLSSGAPIDPSASYVVAGWASVNEGTEGPPIYDVVSDYIEKAGTVAVKQNDSVKIVGI
ncbi:thiosulfohydrolase SoxB [Hwanghaeella grinnelliae]|uniref:Thiosulfohydrolase SoxB n=1 Tax=Hwanghaeella grinnelliae TaxID=2500179 RepID=A0A3S2Y4B2_9PROT|nr:thiosulfohydrolase SoxB [Hwanghaeella grinnelliae]RVU38174.1 thiosulfohydrolase SoxB [Hwanghaeella grinnelliae]